MPNAVHSTTTHEDSRSMANDVLRRFGALTRRAGSAPGTAAAPPQSESARPSFVNDEAAIERGHRQRRELLARRRAEQQVEILRTESARLHVELSVEQITAVAIDTYRACMAVARR